MKILLISLLFTLSSFSQTDSLLTDIEDLLPVAGTDKEINLPEEEQSFSLELRNRYHSNPNYINPKIYNRIKSSYSNYSAGLITEKDPGENNITDFYSFYAAYRDTGIIRQVIAGNYLITFGYGLAAGSAYNVFKTSDPTYPSKKSICKLTGYTSTDENKYYGGTAFEAGYEDLTFYAYYSNNRFDASVDSNGYITYLPISGLHITDTELNRQKAGGIKSFGFSSVYNSTISLGLFYSYNKFDHQYSSFAALKEQYSNISLFFKIPLNNEVIISGENSSDLCYTNSLIMLSFKASKYISYVSSVRLYKKGFSSFYSGSFNESGLNGRNENGFYNGCRLKMKPFTLDLYYDFYSIGSIKSNYNGSEIMIKGEYIFSPQSFLRIKYQSKEATNSYTGSGIKKNLSMELGLSLSEEIFYRLKGELSRSHFNSLPEEGYVLYNDIQFRTKKLTAEMRVTLFQCLGYNATIYEYEREMPGLFRGVLSTGEGTRWFIYLSYNWLSFLDISFKYNSASAMNLQTDFRF